MQVSIETLNGLERKLNVSLPIEEFEKEMDLRFTELARQVKMDGFRPGKAPLNLVKSRYLDSVRKEVTDKMINKTIPEALKQNKMVPAGPPLIDSETVKFHPEFRYSAFFEIMPTFELIELNKTPVELISAEVTTDDLKAMLDKLREQNKEWREVEHKAEKGNKVVIDFEGFIDDKPFEGGKAVGHELILGSGTMIPGFEEGIIGAQKGSSFDVKVQFPADYGHQHLSGKEALFKMTLHKVMEGTLPELDEAFATKFNIKEGGVEGLSKEILADMSRELTRRLNTLNKERLFDALIKCNPFELPVVLINEEIKHLKHEMYHRVFGHEHHADEKIPDFPRELFEESAKRRVHLGLLFSEYVKKHQITAEQSKIDAMLDLLAGSYEDPEALRQAYRANQERMHELKILALEETVADKLTDSAEVSYKKMDYYSVMNPKQDTETKGE